MTKLTYKNANEGDLVKWYKNSDEKWLIGIIIEVRRGIRGACIYMDGIEVIVDLDVDQDIYLVGDQ